MIEILTCEADLPRLVAAENAPFHGRRLGRLSASNTGNVLSHRECHISDGMPLSCEPLLIF